MRHRSRTARRIVAGLCLAVLLCLALSPAGPGLPCAVPAPFVSWIDPGAGFVWPQTGTSEPPASEDPSTAAPRAPPLA
jgi:hypothetical protein